MATPAKQVAALPWRRRGGGVQVLMVTSRETRRWVIPKGWPMKRLQGPDAAKLEAYEEAGVEGRVRRKAIGHYTYDKRSADGTTRTCIVTVYALAVTRMHSRWPERRERTRRWLAAEEAARKVAEADLAALIRAFATG